MKKTHFILLFLRIYIEKKKKISKPLIVLQKRKKGNTIHTVIDTIEKRLIIALT